MSIRSTQARRATLLATSILGLSIAAQAAPTSAELPTNLFITPLAIPGATQILLNPRLPDYPNFVAGEALQEAVSPNGTTLAIVTGGQNSLDASTGATDVANSTQYIFLYDISGAKQRPPALLQVIKQTNAHRGLLWSPDGQTRSA